MASSLVTLVCYLAMYTLGVSWPCNLDLTLALLLDLDWLLLVLVVDWALIQTLLVLY